jgi:large subunit ribosomal protein L3
MKAIIGTKIGMTQIFDEHGKAIPVTLIHAVPNTVTQIKFVEKDGYKSVQFAAGTSRKMTKPLIGHLKKGGIESARKLKEFRLADENSDLAIGNKIEVSVFQAGDRVQVTGISKGKGFAGVIKRHGFHRSPESHGADHQRQPGAIGSQRPQRVVKGKKMPGRMGQETVTVKNLTVIKVDPEHHLLAVRGAVPGPNKSFVYVKGQ